MDLTARQAQVLAHIKRSLALNGFPPTRAEIAAHFGWKSGNAAEEHLQALQRKGAIDLTRGTARGIKVSPPVREGSLAPKGARPKGSTAKPQEPDPKGRAQEQGTESGRHTAPEA